MKTASIILLAVSISTALPAFGWAQNTPLSAKHKAWLEDEVAYIITPVERDVFKKLETDADRDGLIEEFWRQRDPTPGTLRNEFKDEHYRRLGFADKTFARGVPSPGRKTERGRIYITLGSPLDVQRITASDVFPIEIWTFQGYPAFGQARLYRILFYQRGGGGDYMIYDPIANSPKDLMPAPRRTDKDQDRNKPEDTAANPSAGVRAVLNKDAMPEDWDEWDAGAISFLGEQMLDTVIEMTTSNIPGLKGYSLRVPSSKLLAEIQGYPQKKIKDDYALAILDHKPVVEVSYSVKFIGNRTAVAVLEGPGGVPFLHIVLVPETISLDRYEDHYLADLRTTLRLSDAAGKTVFQRENSIPIDLQIEELKRLQAGSFQLYDAVPVIPGKWTLSLLLENLATKEFTTVEKAIEVPGPGGLGMSPLILTRKVFRDASAAGEIRAFQAGRVQVYPSVNNVFPEKSKFFAFMQLRGLTDALKAEGRMRFALSSEGRTLWSDERALKDYPEPEIVVEEIAADKLAAAAYTLRAGLADGEGREILAAQTEVLLTADSVPGLWPLAQPLPPAGDPAIDYALGMQALNTGRTESAAAALGRAATAEPAVVPYAVGYAKALLAAGNPVKALAVLLPSAESKDADFEFFETLGRAARGAGQAREAVTWLNRSLSLRGNVAEVLNLLGECHADLG
ncbi:MAG: GWxTD domain-containing protein, partial [Acidobacteriota bacterium]|nr:GWxTD domain-containing protein [Acidobacteriota bacterium]